MSVISQSNGPPLSGAELRRAFQDLKYEWECIVSDYGVTKDAALAYNKCILDLNALLLRAIWETRHRP